MKQPINALTDAAAPAVVNPIAPAQKAFTPTKANPVAPVVEGQTPAPPAGSAWDKPPVKRAPLQNRPAVPASRRDTGMERSMANLADKLHPRKGR